MFSKDGVSPEIKTLERIHSLFSRAEKEFTRSIGCPICVADCGKCCEVNNITVKGIEARYISMWLRRQPLPFQKKVVDVCHDWLFHEFEKVGTRWGLGTAKMPPNILDQLFQEVAWLCRRSPCPMLTEDKRCLIYPARPIVCQAYGITRVTPIELCKRPLGKFEEGPYRAYLNNRTTEKIRDSIETLKGEIEGRNYINAQGFIGTMLYLEMEPQRFLEFAYHNDIASAKLALLHGGYYLWQEQLQENWDRESEMQMIINPMAGAIEPLSQVVEAQARESEEGQ